MNIRLFVGETIINPRYNTISMKPTPDEELEKLMEELSLLKNSETVVVEGTHDKKALQTFGIRNVITLIQPRYKVIEACKKEAVILTDLDAEGKKIYAELKNELLRGGVKINDRFRNFLLKQTQLRQIEGLETYINHLRQMCKHDQEPD